MILVLNEVYGKIKMSKEHRDHVEAARKHAQKGEFSQAYESLKRLPFGVGLNDEEMFDESLMEAAKHQGASEKELRSLEVFLASDVRYRKAFRNALTRQNDAEKRAKLVAVYAKLNDEHRKIRLLAVGKMDPAEAEEFLYACAEAAVNTFHDVNVLLAQWEERRRKNWFVRAARFCIR